MQFTKQTKIIAAFTAVAIVLLAGASGYFIGQMGKKNQNDNRQSISDVQTEQKETELVEADKKLDDLATEGAITGSLTYPSEGIPSELVVHAYNIDTQEDYFVKDHIQGDQFKYGKGYTITVPPGKYHVYGVYEEAYPDQRAYFNESIKCQLAGSTTGCTDYSKIIVTVEPGKEYAGAIVGDWYKPCVIPGGKQPTQKFDLPTC